MMKHIVNTTILLLALLLPVTALAFEVDGIYYYINGNGVEVTSSPSNNQYNGDVTIPATVTYNGTTYPVTAIRDYAFRDCISLSSIVIPNSVTTIGDGAFYCCESLNSIDIPNSVTTIGDGAFGECTGLTSVTIGNSVTTIGNNAFYRCESLNSIDIPNSVTTIGDEAFGECTGLTSVTIGNSVTTIGEYAFEYCSSLTNVTIGNSVQYIGKYAFYGCSSLNSIDLPNSLTIIGIYAFSDCTGLTSLTLPNSVNVIDGLAFCGCDLLNDVYSYISDLSVINMTGDVFWRSPINYDARTLHVPIGSVAAYQADTRWSQYFGSIVEIKPVLAEAIKLNVTTAGLNEGSTLQLTATVLPEECDNKTVLWSSNDPSVATVDSNGLVTTHSVGTTTITAVTTDGSNLNASCTVTLLPVGVKGDMNGDGRVTITDVTSLIDYLLSGLTW